MENYHSHKHFLPFLCFFLLLLSGQQGVEASDHDHNVNVDGDDRDHDLVYSFYPTKLFVFGDSYSDTGNSDKSKPYKCWKHPYGITFPGKPTGRFSDGRIFTDYLAKFVEVKSPLPYQKWREMGGKGALEYGMNFAYGGTGVFETLLGGPNLTTQIDLFQKLIKQSVITTTDLHSSLALVTIAGNDYSTFQAKNVSAQDYPSFITAMVDQTCLNLKHIRELGVKIIAMTNFQPLGCLPRLTAKISFQHCNDTLNELVNLHNTLLRQAVAKLNDEVEDSSPFLIIDLYASFMSIFEKKGVPQGGIEFENLLKPCCVGTSSEYSCGSVDQSGLNKYTICDDPKSAFFWDNLHLTQQGWKAVYSALQPTLYQLFESNGVYLSS
ncbi:hypothetical protein FNV43_RR02655 [Rhamnella rubrinervis]|uniref:GDSL esterase/lipase At5g03610-like n=1 Tax=Rhamnella rubrinervis TaxID=2594499 RepID=A0A8K0HTU8_9ROSA|nr:hypothetical protein FNV43_RR02655 [Rhamnella rubrinervis]